MIEHENHVIVVRRARESDADAILACLAAAFEPVRSQYTADGFADTVLSRQTIETRLASMSVFVALNDGSIIGTIGCNATTPEEGHLRGMAVLPSWQGTPVAQSLLEAAESELRNLRCQKVTLDTTEPLRRAIRFYEKNGYRATGQVKDFFGMRLFEFSKPL